ncbi:Ig-like domain-containing protein, partial [Spirochaetota bacterium]
LDSSDKDTPRITSQTPAPDDVGVDRSAVIFVDFSIPVRNLNGASGTFSLRRLGEITDVPAQVDYNSASYRATLDPNDNLEADSIYVVTLTNGITGPTGIPLSGSPVVWIFTTSNVVDSSNPEIEQRKPNIGEDNIAVD